jgi:hypothetical protein
MHLYFLNYENFFFSFEEIWRLEGNFNSLSLSLTHTHAHTHTHQRTHFLVLHCETNISFFTLPLTIAFIISWFATLCEFFLLFVWQAIDLLLLTNNCFLGLCDIL